MGLDQGHTMCSWGGGCGGQTARWQWRMGQFSTVLPEIKKPHVPPFLSFFFLHFKPNSLATEKLNTFFLASNPSYKLSGGRAMTSTSVFLQETVETLLGDPYPPAGGLETGCLGSHLGFTTHESYVTAA